MEAPLREGEYESDWHEIVDQSPVPTVIIADNATEQLPTPNSLQFANRSAAQLLAQNQSAARTMEWLQRRTSDGRTSYTLPVGDADSTRASDRGDATDLCIQRLSSGNYVGQFISSDRRDALDQILVEQQQFRSALLELSELAYTAGNDEEFYQRLLERAVEVVPGAQGGSVQLNVPTTGMYRFVAAVGYDLEGLQQHELNSDHFFRDAFDPDARIVRDLDMEGADPEILEWLETVGRLHEIVVNVSAPVFSNGIPVAFLSLDNFEDSEAITETSVEMTTVLARLIGELWRRRGLEAELRKEREAYHHLAMHDPVTGLANRRNLQGALKRLMTAANQRERPSAVLFVDIDNFKGVNDRFGHDAGDRLLQQVATGLQRAVRAGDTVGRWGGDEFLILPHRISTATEAMDLAKRVHQRFDHVFDIGCGVSHDARLSIGVGWTADSRVDADGLVRAADEALYEAKAAGKGVFRMREA